MSDTLTATCPHCAAPCETDATFCSECGKALVKNVKPRRTTTGKTSTRIAENANAKTIRGARIALGVVALITFGFTLFIHMNFNSDIAAARTNPELVVDETIVSQTIMVFVLHYIFAAVFVGLMFWTKKNPFAACLTGLILYITLNLIGIAVDPESLFKGILMKIFVIIYLGHGVRAGLSFRRLQENNLR